MFVILYQPTDAPVKVKDQSGQLTIVGQWQVDTTPDGSVATEDDLTIALSRVKDIRKKGGEAALAVIIE